MDPQKLVVKHPRIIILDYQAKIILDGRILRAHIRRQATNREKDRAMPNTITFFATHAEARAVVDALNQDDDKWTYTVGERPGGKFVVQVYDEEGFLLGVI
jgi:hypothetical protein